jgi:hypothetical protein
MAARNGADVPDSVAATPRRHLHGRNAAPDRALGYVENGGGYPAGHDSVIGQAVELFD